jgi:sulfatase maturation enzyme AslB (radical SAM superfamily)
MKGIELPHKNKVEFNTLSIVLEYNVHYASETYRFLKKIGSGFLQFLPVVERIRKGQQENSLTLVAPVHGKADVYELIIVLFLHGYQLRQTYEVSLPNDDSNDIQKYFFLQIHHTLNNQLHDH